jgi:hypothetical protein
LNTKRNNAKNQPLFKLAPAKETKKSDPVLTEKQIAFVNRNPSFRGEITDLPTPKSKENFETNYGQGYEDGFEIYTCNGISNLIRMMPIENAEIIADYVYNNATSEKIDSLPSAYKKLAQRIKGMSSLEFHNITVQDYIAQYKEANDIK